VSTFTLSVRVYYEDTDSGGVVYYANYLRFMERARTEWLRSLGFEQDELLRDNGILFAVRTAKLDFLKPARFNDLLEVTAEPERQGKASVDFRQQVRRGEELLCTGEIRLACIDAERFVPAPIPEEIARRFPSAGGPVAGTEMARRVR
jgi:acyl-CoA thioester hydrolase